MHEVLAATLLGLAVVIFMTGSLTALSFLFLLVMVTGMIGILA